MTYIFTGNKEPRSIMLTNNTLCLKSLQDSYTLGTHTHSKLQYEFAAFALHSQASLFIGAKNAVFVPKDRQA